jgi:hypothetical protein
MRTHEPSVYIPTMNRYGNLERIVPLWLRQGFLVRLVVEPKEYDEHARFIMRMGWIGKGVTAIPVGSPGRGIGYARKACVLHAEHTGRKSIIMSDDDMRPAGDMRPLLDAAADPGALGVGAVRGIHDYFTGGAISRTSGVILCPGGWGFQLFGLNVANTVLLGNFDERLHSYGEDGELARQGIKAGIFWRSHCDVKCAPIGKRYAPGGISTRFAKPEYRTDAERQCLAIIHDRWPYYTNPPDRPLRVAWQRMLDHYIPDWRDRSALHGGSL